MKAGEFLTLWLDTYVRPFRRPNTAACYQRAIAALPPSLLGKELSTVDAMEYQQAINCQAQEHPRAAQLTFAMLHAALAKAVKLHKLHENPLDACEKPKHEPKRAVVLTAEQMRVYLMAARDTDVYPLLLLMATCGLRRGEALGLTWECFNGDVLHVSHQRVRCGGAYQLAPCKSRTSDRLIPLPSAVADVLTVAGLLRTSAFVVDTTPEHLTRIHGRIIKRAGLPPVTLHGLRHSMATIAADNGETIKALQQLLGHSHYQLTADLYTAHRMDAAVARAAAAVAGLVL